MSITLRMSAQMRHLFSELDEFEKIRLQKTQLKFQANIYKNWQHGFYIDIPLIAENSSDQPYLF